MIIISAMGRNRVIGSGDGMPWNVPDEYRQFLERIRDQTVIMGRRSWEIFGADLTSARNLVVSRSAGSIEGAEVVGSIDEAVERGQVEGRLLFSAGGAQIYRQTLPLAERMVLSFIKGEFTGNAYFPEFDESEWRVVERHDHAAYELVIYDRRANRVG